MVTLRQATTKQIEKFDNAIRQAKSEKVALTLLRDKKRWLCRNDLFYLACLTGHTKIQEFGSFYRPFCDEVSLLTWQVVRKGVHPANDDLLPIEKVSDDIENDFAFTQRLYLAYRLFYKTTIVSKLHSLQLLLNFPNIHIVLANNKLENASDNLVAVKNMFLSTPLSYLFSECIPKTAEWGNKTGFSSANRTDKGRSEENIEAIGVDVTTTGRHWQVAKKNDIIDDKTITTEEQLKKIAKWDDTFNIGMVDNPQEPLQDYEGTRYHYIDRYSELLDNGRIKKIVIPILKDYDKFVQTHSPEYITHPERYTPDGILSLMDNKWVFFCQLMLEPKDTSQTQFSPDMILYYLFIPKECNFYLLVDPASKRKKRSDYTAMLVIGVDSKGIRYICDVIRDKLDPKQRIDTAIELAKKWNIRESGWEEVGLGDDNFYLEEARRKAGIHFIVTPVKTVQIAKVDRIRNILMPEYSQHKWLWAEKGTMLRYSQYHGKMFDMTEELELEFLRFPLSEHDDLLDAQTFLSQLHIVLPKENMQDQGDKEMTFGEYYKIREDRLAEIRTNPWGNILAGRG